VLGFTERIATANRYLSRPNLSTESASLGIFSRDIQPTADSELLSAQESYDGSIWNYWLSLGKFYHHHR